METTKKKKPLQKSDAQSAPYEGGGVNVCLWQLGKCLPVAQLHVCVCVCVVFGYLHN